MKKLFIIGFMMVVFMLVGCFSRPNGMRYIPGGTFLMGSADTNFIKLKPWDRYYWDRYYKVAIAEPPTWPVHRVIVSKFFMDTTEVTQDEYLLLMKSNPSQFVGESYPVENVTWYDAVLFCNARSKRDHVDTIYAYNSIVGRNADGEVSGLWGLTIDMKKNGYRLPTEAEYEYACRAGSTTDYYWGGMFPPVASSDTLAMDSNAVWKHNSQKMTQPVASKKPNAWGLYDMVGNVSEWCNDWYGDYSSTVQKNPSGARTGMWRVQRGSGWDENCISLRSAHRSSYSPGFQQFNFGSGFRCVRR